jgi:FtsZ-binding cell division protein ZapB
MKIDWNVVWTAVAAIAAALTMIGTLAMKLWSSIRNRHQKDVDDLKEENKRLRDEMQSRLQLPSFGLDAIKLTEIAAQRKIDEMQNEYKTAIEMNDETLASELSKQIAEIELLRTRVEASSNERDALQERLRNVLTARPPTFGKNAIGLPCGLILLVRSQGKYGAILAVEQSHANRGSRLRYVSWYQSDGSSDLLAPNVIVSFAETSEKRPGPSPMINVGPICLEWSVGGEGQGWVYYGYSGRTNLDIELAMTNSIDLSTIDLDRAGFRRRED